MTGERWGGTSVLYVCPLKDLLNNLLPRLETCTSWLGRTAALWHGGTPAGVRKHILAARPDVLLTTPESLEAMLVSANVDHTSFFSGLRVVVVDEVHASPATTGDGTFSPYSKGSNGSLADRCSASVSRRLSATRRRCSPGCRAQGRTSGRDR